MQTRRERVRQAAIDEIKAIAWGIANEHGLEDVTVNGIARQMGMTPPAFYSYFKSRDELIKTLVIDAYRSFRETLLTAGKGISDSDTAGRLYQVMIAYREWAIANPSLFGLFAGRPVHGFKDREPEVIEESEKVYVFFLSLYEEAWQKGLISLPQQNSNMPDEYVGHLEKLKERYGLSLPIAVLNMIVKGLILGHGMISMELSGRLADLGGDPFPFYQFQVLAMLGKLGIHHTPAPSR